MKKILTLIIIVSCSIATMATPDPRKKNQKKVRVNDKTTSIPLPSRGRR